MRESAKPAQVTNRQTGTLHVKSYQTVRYTRMNEPRCRVFHGHTAPSTHTHMAGYGRHRRAPCNECNKSCAHPCSLRFMCRRPSVRRWLQNMVWKPPDFMQTNRALVPVLYFQPYLSTLLTRTCPTWQPF